MEESDPDLGRVLVETLKLSGSHFKAQDDALWRQNAVNATDAAIESGRGYSETMTVASM